MIRIDKYLALKNICSRNDVQKFLKNNEVKVNDNLVIKKDFKINEFDFIIINSQKYTYEKYVYYLMNKPKNYICSNIDELYPSVLNLLNKFDYQTDLFTVGRLDVDTTGVLLITNDGKFAHNLVSPSRHVKKTYEIILEYDITNEQIDSLNSGVYIDNDHFVKPLDLEILGERIISFSITEGRHHQVKKMIHSIGNDVTELKRVSFGDYKLDFEQVYIKLDSSTKK